MGCLGGAGLDDAPGVFVSESDALNGILSNAIDLTVHDSNKIRGMYGKYVIVSRVCTTRHRRAGISTGILITFLS